MNKLCYFFYPETVIFHLCVLAFSPTSRCQKNLAIRTNVNAYSAMYAYIWDVTINKIGLNHFFCVSAHLFLLLLLLVLVLLLLLSFLLLLLLIYNICPIYLHIAIITFFSSPSLKFKK